MTADREMNITTPSALQASNMWGSVIHFCLSQSFGALLSLNSYSMLGKRYEWNSVCTSGCLQSMSKLRKTALRCLLGEGDLNKRCGTSVLFSVYSFITPVCHGIRWDEADRVWDSMMKISADESVTITSLGLFILQTLKNEQTLPSQMRMNGSRMGCHCKVEGRKKQNSRKLPGLNCLIWRTRV